MNEPMNPPAYFDIPTPKDLDSIVAINTGVKWMRGIIPGSVTVENGIITFSCKWSQGITKTVSMAADLVGGFECDSRG